MPTTLLEAEPCVETAWSGFERGTWCERIDVRDFIQRNFTPYGGDGSFLSGPTDRTRRLWERVTELMAEEAENGILDADTDLVSTITSHSPGYISRALEVIVGLQTEEPLKRALLPQGGIRMLENALKSYGYELSPRIKATYGVHGARKTHNDGVFDAYTAEMRAARSSGIITGLPDSYGRGRIIGDYRRVALYGVDRLIEEKRAEHASLPSADMDEDIIRLSEELSEQQRALQELKVMAASYDCDISHPATSAREAVQWLYFGYLGAVKEQNGAAMSLGRTSTFLDIYFERDLAQGLLTEREAQELIDQFVMKLRMVRYLRTPEYNELFSGDPTWVTESIGGVSENGTQMVTKTSFRYLNTLFNLGAAPEPNLTVLWSTQLPRPFKEFAAKVSVETSAVQYENDDVMREVYGDDYGIACCVSAMRIGKQMQYFGARANLAKALNYAINGGRDEISGKQVAPKTEPISGDVLDYDEVMAKYEALLDWLAGVYVGALNIIHFMHDKYSYERLEMALHDRDVQRMMAFGIAGLSVAADSLSAIKYATVRPIRDDTGLVVDYETEGEFPTFGNADERVDSIAGRARPRLHEQDPHAPHLPQLGCEPVDPDDHVERGLREAHRAPHPTAARPASPSLRAPTRCTDATFPGPSLRCARSPAFPTSTPRTASPTPSRSCLRRSATRRRSASTSSWACSMATSAKAATTSTSTCSTGRCCSTPSTTPSATRCSPCACRATP